MAPEPQRIAQARRLAELALAHLRALLLDAVVERDGPLCVYCRVETILQPAPSQRYRERTLDHIVPKSRGGADTLENCVLACRSCNARKGTRPVRQYAPRALSRMSEDGMKCQG
jgi:5-methylcytosine-specific restriction endonuclease McrA